MDLTTILKDVQITYSICQQMGSTNESVHVIYLYVLLKMLTTQSEQGTQLTKKKKNEFKSMSE